jgi:hypothetical protein
MLFVCLFVSQNFDMKASAQWRKSSKRAISTTRFTGSLQFAEQRGDAAGSYVAHFLA